MTDEQKPPISADERARTYGAKTQQAREYLDRLHDDGVSIFDSQPGTPWPLVARAIAIVAGTAALAYVCWGLATIYLF